MFSSKGRKRSAVKSLVFFFINLSSVEHVPLAPRKLPLLTRIHSGFVKVRKSIQLFYRKESQLNQQGSQSSGTVTPGTGSSGTGAPAFKEGLVEQGKAKFPPLIQAIFASSLRVFRAAQQLEQDHQHSIASADVVHMAHHLREDVLKEGGYELYVRADGVLKIRTPEHRVNQKGYRLTLATLRAALGLSGQSETLKLDPTASDLEVLKALVEHFKLKP